MHSITENSKKVSQFMNTYTGLHIKNLAPALVANIVQNMGGVAAFATEYEKVLMNSAESNTLGFKQTNQRTQFYKDNKDALLDYCAEIASREGYGSAMKFVITSLPKDIEETATLDQIAKIMFGGLSDEQVNAPDALVNEITSFIVYLAIEEICEEFSTMLESD